MLAYLALARQPDDTGAFAAAARSLSPMFESGDWRCIWSGDQGVALVRTGAELNSQVLVPDLGFVIGDLFPRRSGRSLLPAGGEAWGFEQQCRRLTADYWGRYVAIRWPTQTSVAAAFRDPSGALDCLVWAAGGVTVVSSELPDDLPAPLRPRLALDWDAVGSLLFDPTRAAGSLALTGVRALWPGELWRDDPAMASTQVWSPAMFASPTLQSDEELRREMVTLVDACVHAWLPPGAAALIEVSGGLDSAIVATAAAKVAAPGQRVWLNYHASNVRSDERRFAREVGVVCSFELTEAAIPVGPLDLDAWRALSGGLRPPLNALALHRDQDVAARCAQGCLSRAFTGEGGDLAFFEAPTALVVADLVQSGAGPQAVLRATHNVARWTGRSAWRTLFEAIGAGRGRSLARQLPPAWPALAERTLRGARLPAHPWLDGLEDVPPGKRLQIEGLIACQSFNGDSHAARSATVVHPLLSQPVVELCLQIPTFRLTRCRRGRALAREAFADRLPPAVTQRRAKGELSSHYGRVLAASLGDLRPRLLDGALARHGLLDRAQLEILLTPESLIVSGAPYAVASAALIETWVSAWEARL